MRISLANEVNVLGTMVDRLSEQNRWFRDYTLEALARAVRETIACFPVYRTYLEPGKPVSEEDRAVIERAVAAAKRRNPAIEESVFNFLRDLLLFQFPENLDEEQRAAHAEFVLKFQQFTGPIMAKGLEDTVSYIYNRLAALNEVGGEPQLGSAWRRPSTQPAGCATGQLACSPLPPRCKRSEDARAHARDFRDSSCGGARAKMANRNRRFKKHRCAGRPMQAKNIAYQTCSGPGRSISMVRQFHRSGRNSLHEFSVT